MNSVKWTKCGNGLDWCPLERLNLESVTGAGVYIIWHDGNPGRVVYVGQADPISSRLSSHRNDPRILKYNQVGTLRVTWAAVPANQRDGVERFLANEWNPLVGSAYPSVQPLVVNSPWA